MTSTSSYVGEEIDQTSFGLEFNEPPAPLQPVVETESEPAAERFAKEIECLCPFCGTLNSGLGNPCATCKQEDTIARRDAASRKTGPWYVLQPNNPDAAGMNFDQLLELIRGESVTSRSIVRGATTGQLWRLASKVRGLSREFGQCYSCGGDIETDETICPHCDRVQTVAEHTDATPKNNSASFLKQELLTDSESPKQVRQTLLAEPVIHVHTISDPNHSAVEVVTPLRPVVAEVSERHYPKDDLLTPADLAKAFQLEFGPVKDELDRFLIRPNHTVRRIKIAMTSVAALSMAALMLWPLTRIVSGWINDNSAKAIASVPSVTAQMPAIANIHSTGVMAYAPPTQAYQPTISYTPAPPAPPAPPITAGAMIQPEPSPAPSAQDDPKLLLDSAMDAESTGHYAAAVAAYERIESLPSNNWPANLEVRLKLARKELKGDVR